MTMYLNNTLVLDALHAPSSVPKPIFQLTLQCTNQILNLPKNNSNNFFLSIQLFKVEFFSLIFVLKCLEEKLLSQKT